MFLIDILLDGSEIDIITTLIDEWNIKYYKDDR
jgi:hypothetical protein